MRGNTSCSWYVADVLVYASRWCAVRTAQDFKIVLHSSCGLRAACLCIASAGGLVDQTHAATHFIMHGYNPWLV